LNSIVIVTMNILLEKLIRSNVNLKVGRLFKKYGMCFVEEWEDR